MELNIGKGVRRSTKTEVMQTLGKVFTVSEKHVTLKKTNLKRQNKDSLKVEVEANTDKE